MMRWVILLAVAWAGVAGAQTTKPTDEVMALRREIAELRATNSILRAEIRRLRETIPDKPAPATAPVLKPVEGRLSLGMSLADAQQATKTRGRLIAEDEGGQTYEFRKTNFSGDMVFTTVTYAVIRDGKVVKHWVGPSTDERRTAPTIDSRFRSR